MPEYKLENARAMRKKPTAAERQLWKFLRAKRLGGLRFRRQSPMLGYIADFYCPSVGLVVELDGGHHNDRKATDAHRDQVMEAHGFTVLRIANELVFGDMLETLRRIGEAANGARSTIAGDC